MGSRGNSNLITIDTTVPRELTVEEIDTLLIKIDKPTVEPLKPTKYAKEIFGSIYYESKQHIKDWGIDNSIGGWNALVVGDDKPVPSLRALKGIQALINTNKRNQLMDAKLGISSVDEVNQKLAALNMVQKTLNSYIEHRKEWS